MNKLTKVVGNKTDIQKSVNRWHFLYKNDKLCGKKIKKMVPLTRASKTMKSLQINLIKEVKDLYSENYKTLIMKKTEDNPNK